MKRVAVFCPIKDEPTHIWRWIEYYTRYFPKQDVYILDFGSKPEYLAEVSKHCSIINTSRNIHDAYELYQTILDVHQGLLRDYDIVIPTDVDEIIYTEQGLHTYIQNLNKEYVTCTGYELLHLPDKEAPYSPEHRVFDQRNYWFKSEQHYSKTLITSKHLNWTIGLHTVPGINKKEDSDPGLYLIHLHRFDYDVCMKRHLKWASMEWSERTVQNNWNYHYRTHDLEKLNQWYYEPVTEIEEIPENIRQGIYL